MSVSIIMFEEFKINNTDKMNEVIEKLYHTKVYEIDNEYNIIELY